VINRQTGTNCQQKVLIYILSQPVTGPE